MLDRLPEQLKSGRTLVATAAGGNVGLYTFPGLDDDYRVVTRAGTVTRGDGETIPRPPSGNWSWLGKEVDDAQVVAEPQHEAGDDGTAATSAVSPIHLCVLCNADTRPHDHAHTRAQGGVGPAETLCCPCMRREGVSCPLAARSAASKAVPA